MFNVKGLEEGGASVERFGKSAVSLWNMLNFSPLVRERTLSVSIEKGSVACVYASWGISGLKIFKAKSFSFSEGSFPSPSETSSAIKIFAGEADIEDISVSICIPRQWVVMRSAEYPVSVSNDLGSVISYGLDSITPFKADDALYDHAVYERSTEVLKVMVAAAKKRLVDDYIDAVKGDGFSVSRVTFSNSCVESLRRLASGGKGTGEMRSYADEELGPGERRDIAVKLPAIGRAGDISYNAVGCAVETVWPRADGMNLLGRVSYAEISSGRPYAFSIFIAAVFGVLIILYLVIPASIERKKLEVMKEKTVELREQAMKAEALKAEIASLEGEMKLINDFSGAPEGNALAVMAELTGILPSDTWLSRFQIKGSSISLEGYSSSATELLKRLENSGFFKSAEFSAPTVKDKRLNSDRFRIKVEVRSGGNNGEK